MSRGRPQASRLRQVVSYLNDTVMVGLASAWAMARRRPREYRRKLDAATRYSGVCPLYLSLNLVEWTSLGVEKVRQCG